MGKTNICIIEYYKFRDCKSYSIINVYLSVWHLPRSQFCKRKKKCNRMKKYQKNLFRIAKKC